MRVAITLLVVFSSICGDRSRRLFSIPTLASAGYLWSTQSIVGETATLGVH